MVVGLAGFTVGCMLGAIVGAVLLVIGAAVAGIIIRSVKRASETGKGAEKK